MLAALSCVAGWLSYVLVERHFLRAQRHGPVNGARRFPGCATDAARAPARLPPKAEGLGLPAALIMRTEHRNDDSREHDDR